MTDCTCPVGQLLHSFFKSKPILVRYYMKLYLIWLKLELIISALLSPGEYTVDIYPDGGAENNYATLAGEQASSLINFNK